MPDHGTMIAELLTKTADASLRDCDMEALQGFMERDCKVTAEEAAWLERIYAKVCRGPR